MKTDNDTNANVYGAVRGAAERITRVPVDRYLGLSDVNVLNVPILGAREEEARQHQNEEAIALGGAFALPGTMFPAHLPVRDGVRRGPRINDENGVRNARTQRSNDLYYYNLFVKEPFGIRCVCVCI